MKTSKILLSLCACAIGMTVAASAVSAAPIKSGTQSEHVLDIQERLSSLGYFKEGVTGYYGSLTAKAVKAFQTANKLPVTGVADDATVAKLKQKAKPKQSSLDQLARIIHSEARGESFEGQVAVGAVVLNRVQSSKFPDSITEVIFQSGQFTAVDDGQYSLQPNSTAYRAARAALNGSDPTNGALYYYNPKIATALWSMARPQIKTIGSHIFTD
ncbi:cell wall hydrolase [Paenibacillus xerothermodurans]|uniref:Cell wall hydrolase n=1 Tax=Paenibacillus xerothermodurans TaxID=1977292 RepID=A0A2W1N9G8_PAEXE|nr:cell wall hydrolase [Paenibacillus xerothermodurans]PZE20574.1 cell wall hydrolase [Paenibacillus xerothermodurans]